MSEQPNILVAMALVEEVAAKFCSVPAAKPLTQHATPIYATAQLIPTGYRSKYPGAVVSATADVLVLLSKHKRVSFDACLVIDSPDGEPEVLLPVAQRRAQVVALTADATLQQAIKDAILARYRCQLHEGWRDWKFECV